MFCFSFRRDRCRPTPASSPSPGTSLASQVGPNLRAIIGIPGKGAGQQFSSAAAAADIDNYSEERGMTKGWRTAAPPPP